jgi:hypothetical protein
MAGGCGAELETLIPRWVRSGRRWKAVGAGGRGAPLFQRKEEEEVGVGYARGPSRKGGPGGLGRLGQMNREKGFSILEIILDLTKDLENDYRIV